MNKLSVLILSVIVTGLLALVSCGGASNMLDVAGSEGRNQEVGLVGAVVPVQHPVGAALPVLPQGTGNASRSASDIVEIAGSAAVESAGGTIDVENIILQSTEADLAWALYKVDGLAGRQPASLELSLRNLSADGEYSVGISNFSAGVWDFLAMSSAEEFAADLSAEVAQMANEAGELYFVVVVSGGAGVTVHSASLESAIDDDDSDELPRLAGEIAVSEGLADSIAVSWAAVDGATGYELWRKTDLDIEGQEDLWVLLATVDAATLSYTDMAIELSVEYKYRVRAISEAGAAGFSDDDSGYAGAPPADDNGSGGSDDGTGAGDDNGSGGGGADDGAGAGDDNGSGGGGADDGAGAGDDNGSGGGGADDGAGAGDDNGSGGGGADDGAGAGDDNGSGGGGADDGAGAGDDNGSGGGGADDGTPV